jgi:two-component sensor histidine kinase
MAATHTLLSKSGWQSVGLDALVRDQLAPYATDTNIAISGTDIMLTAAETQAVAKVLHELGETWRAIDSWRPRIGELGP